MANIMRDYHKNLQRENLDQSNHPNEHIEQTREFLKAIPENQTLKQPETSTLNWAATPDQI
jgi:hypothetical protein